VDEWSLIPKRENGPEPEILPALSDTLPRIAEHFSRLGALGLVLIDGGAIRDVENRHGFAARERIFRALESVIRDVSGQRLRADDIVVTGDPGRSEIAVLIFRDREEGDFYRAELTPLASQIRRAIQRNLNRILYPFERARAGISTGLALAFRNPLYGEVTQIRRALDEARNDAELSDRRSLRVDKRALIRLLLNGRVHSVYEPIVDSKTFTVFAYEALSRGPEGTSLAAPLALFELAERTGLVFELDCLCRRRALDGAIDFPAGSKLFLNIRPSAFHDPSFQPDELCRTLERCRLAPTDVVFEISEQESIENFSMFRQARDDYGAIGFQFALDDTGSGYASFQSVMELAPEFVKVDRTFVAGIDSDPARQAILHGFQTIADRINARIIGEGLDTLEELETLRELGIPFGQGWLFGKPTPLRADWSTG
jgi:EAL domain-containing protein (putative c-di-GMP-specific phosphodiesterase class I)